MTTRPKREISRQTLRALRESRPNNYGQYCGDYRVFDVAVGKDSFERVVALIDRLFDVLAEGGIDPKLVHIDGTQVLVVDGEKFRFRFAERLTKTPHQPTPEERARIRRGETYPRVPKWDYGGSGSLRLELAEGTSYSCAITWEDGKQGRVEDRLAEVVPAIRRLIEERKEYRIRAEESARVHAAQERERYRRESSRKRRAERVRALVAETARWHEAVLLRRYAEALRVAMVMARSGAPASGKEEPFVDELLRAAAALDPIPARIRREEPGEAVIDEVEKTAAEGD
jgi:hypothetical protein